VTGIETDLSYVKGFSKYGESAAVVAARFAPLAHARRSNVGLEEAVRNQILLEKGIGLEGGIYNQMEQLSLLEGRTGMSNIQYGISAMRSGGIVKGEDMSAVPDYLQLMVQLGKEQVARLGKIDMGVNMKMVSALGNMDDTLKRSPEALSTMVNAIRGGLTGARSPQVEALQYSVLSKIKPGASMFELMEMKENPFSQENQRYLPEYLKQLYQMSNKNDERFYMNIGQQFGLSAAMSRKLGTGFLSGKLNEVLDQGLLDKEGVKGIEKRAERVTPAQVSTATWTENQAIAVADGIAKISNYIPAPGQPLPVVWFLHKEAKAKEKEIPISH
jgi:hypothetical protein